MFRSLGAISQDQFQRCADRHDLGRVLSTEVLGGAHGNNIGVTTERGAWILRGVVPPLDVASLRREQFFAQALHERSAIASPWPYWIGESDAIFGWPYAIMRRLPGSVLHPAFDTDWTIIGGGLGRAAAGLHRVTFLYFGEWSSETGGIVSPGISAPEWFERRVRDLVKRVARTSIELDATSSAIVNELVDRAMPEIGDFEPTYVHGDLAVGNLVGEQSPDGFSFTGVFDLGSGYAGDPDEDLATPMWWPLYWGNSEAAVAFLESYRAARPARPGEVARLLGYVAMSMLTNWEFGRRQGFDWYRGSDRFYEWATPLLDQVEAIVRSRR